MSRSGLYESDDIDDMLQYGRWRGAVASAMRGKRGQAALREIAAAMDAMPEKTLTANELEADGEFCTVGVLMHARGLDRKTFDIDDYDAIAAALGVNAKIVQEIEFANDQSYQPRHWVEVEGPPAPRHGWWSPGETVEAYVDNPEAGAHLWQSMREFIGSRITEATGGAA
jgi:hypothetical protein